MIPVGASIFIFVHYYIQPPYHHSIYCRHRSDGPHLCEDVRLYPDANLKYLINPNWSDDPSWREHVADTGANIHTSAAMTPVDMSKIIFTPLITILFIADTGTMAPICVMLLGCTLKET